MNCESKGSAGFVKEYAMTAPKFQNVVRVTKVQINIGKTQRKTEQLLENNRTVGAVLISGVRVL